MATLFDRRYAFMVTRGFELQAGVRFNLSTLTLMRCYTECSERTDCLAWSHDSRHECRHSAIPKVFASNKNSSVVGVLNRHALAWLKYKGPNGQYRLGDVLLCSGGFRLLFRLEYYCSGLDALNVAQRWPSSIASAYSRLTRFPRDYETLFSIIKPRLRHETQNACVVHVRSGDVFSDCNGKGEDCTPHTAKQLWDGHNGVQWRSTFGERYIHPKSDYERVARRIPKRVTDIEIFGKPHKVSNQRGQHFFSLVHEFFRQRYPSVRTFTKCIECDSARAVDTDFLYMSGSSCFVSSQSSYSAAIGKMVERNGGVHIPMGDERFD